MQLSFRLDKRPGESQLVGRKKKSRGFKLMEIAAKQKVFKMKQS
jgi:hypothetical protein